MIFRRPLYFDSFTCTADKCSDNCCIGWEICIDKETADFYKTVDGRLGEKLRRCISEKEDASFILNNDRCPFLDGNNLCEIISELGKASLCQICRDHPRWFNWYGNFKEGGIGLACEEGARLILGDKDFDTSVESQLDEEEEDEDTSISFLFWDNIRESLLDALYCKKYSFEKRACQLLDITATAEFLLTDTATSVDIPEEFDFNRELEKALPVLAETEPINEIWTAELEKLLRYKSELKPTEEEYEYLARLVAYFLRRYFLDSVYDNEATKRVYFALFSVTVIFALYCASEERSLDSLIKSAVLYSKQMEYSDINIDIFYELYFDKKENEDDE